MLLNREVTFACENQCFVLSTANGDPTDARLLGNLLSSHEEADTLLILHTVYVDQTTNSPDTDIIIRSTDTDVFLLLIALCQKYTHPLYFDIGTGNKRKMIKINYYQKIDKDVQNAILELHAFTGCDVNNAFVQKGKSKPLNILKKNLEYEPVSYTSTNKLRHDTSPEIHSERNRRFIVQ